MKKHKIIYKKTKCFLFISIFAAWRNYEFDIFTTTSFSIASNDKKCVIRYDSSCDNWVTCFSVTICFLTAMRSTTHYFIYIWMPKKCSEFGFEGFSYCRKFFYSIFSWNRSQCRCRNQRDKLRVGNCYYIAFNGINNAAAFRSWQKRKKKGIMIWFFDWSILCK